MRLIRNPLAVIAVLSAALALGGPSAASAATHVAKTEPVNLYLYTGKGSFVPKVKPTKIYTADGTIIDEQGQPLERAQHSPHHFGALVGEQPQPRPRNARYRRSRCEPNFANCAP